MHNIQIDSEFQALIPPLSAEERAQLEANLLADGCRDPLVVWPCATFDIRPDGGAPQALGDEVFASTIQASLAAGDAPAVELDDAEIERSIREINEAIKRSSHKKP